MKTKPKALERGAECFVSWRTNELSPATVVSHHPEMNAVKVRVSGEEWILQQSEVFPIGAPESTWPEWLKKFVATIKATKSKTSATKPNKAEAARELHMDYALVLRTCKRLEAMGVSLVPL